MRVVPRAWTRRAAATSLALALLAGVGCARRPAVAPPPPPAPPRPFPGYERLADSLALVDASGLAGRRIALDPGHGGFFRGALGVHGLTEAEVNLAVALRLRDLVAGRGAEVFLTRDRDRDFLGPPDSSLRADLAERVRLANAFGPDLFLSIHHNADAAGAHDVNETQTYYKLGDDGASLDAAQDVHRALVRNVGIRPHKVVPGNYFVLRGSEAPALLTETSYITNPDVEARLRLPEKQELEAEALFIGLARYFARRVPVIAEFRAVDPSGGEADSVFRTGNPSIRARVEGDFDRVDLRVDGRPVSPTRTGGRIEWAPAGPWAGGTHEATLQVRLGGVGAARERRLRFTAVRSAASLTARGFGGMGLSRAGPLAAVRLELRERGGTVHVDSLPAPDRIRIRRASGRGVRPADTVVVARDGVAWAYFRRVEPLTRAVRFQATDTVRSEGATGVLKDEFAFTPSRQPATDWLGFVTRMPGGEPLREAPGTREPDPTLRWMNRDGFAVLPRDGAGAIAVPRLPGFRRWADDSAGAPGFVPVAGGALQGRRITLDPEGGGEDPAGTGASGTRAAHLNLEVARILAGFLSAAGAEVHLTRAGDLALSEVERVQGSEDFRADRYLRIGHRARRFGYYFSSPAGRRWAERTGAAFVSLGLAAPPAGEDALYPLQQTSCPALYASPARVDSAGDEAALLAPGALRAEAYALFLGLAREWAPAAVWAVDSLAVRDQAGAPVPGARVTLGDALVLETDRFGRVRFARTEPGPIAAVVDEPRVRARAVLLDFMRGAVLTGPRGN
ncbi:MAG: N-acetylmuramoyl-L-alanine amidase [Candidatus Eisenbacteria bacterium]